MFKAFIVDDEPLARDELAFLLKRSKQVEIAGEGDSIESSLSQIQGLQIDVIFLDIQLANESGLDLAEKIMNLDPRPEIVFATAYDEYALKAFELQAIDYIMKPFDESRVLQTVKKLEKVLKSKENRNNTLMDNKLTSDKRNDKLAVTMDERIVLIPVHEIVYIGTIEGRTVIVTDKQRYQVNEPLITYEKKLQQKSIVRVHRGYLVNLDKIVEIQPWFHSTYNLIMKDGEKIPVSRTFTKDLKKHFGF
ncbi:LytTR family DNA-binding domain-containing protein [Bacillus sp. NEB1478]|uniref:LytR/AlgR family response regulator transcription factor n=1 Tax=Bacillus sp. NEB1478 TaxID=3073816 RepID=UPI002873170C|nr:LytTR family DNA-binding domain-containing protein [Bacillus sp. NEB1478]WNB91839.1 LytTR family DNA-binding domain-containing protein [Bacillus sp. NEB1478]